MVLVLISPHIGIQCLQYAGLSFLDEIIAQQQTQLVLVQIAWSDAQFHKLHGEQHKHEQCLILLVIIHNYATHNTHLIHNIVLLCTCAYSFFFFLLFEQLFTLCCACVVHKVKNCAQMHNCTKNLHNANNSCILVSIVQVCCA